ncbi:hypothetical protein ACB098_05G179700 [Castanea mollissima]
MITEERKDLYLNILSIRALLHIQITYLVFAITTLASISLGNSCKSFLSLLMTRWKVLITFVSKGEIIATSMAKNVLVLDIKTLSLGSIEVRSEPSGSSKHVTLLLILRSTLLAISVAFWVADGHRSFAR